MESTAGEPWRRVRAMSGRDRATVAVLLGALVAVALACLGGVSARWLSTAPASAGRVHTGGLALSADGPASATVDGAPFDVAGDALAEGTTLDVALPLTVTATATDITPTLALNPAAWFPDGARVDVDGSLPAGAEYRVVTDLDQVNAGLRPSDRPQHVVVMFSVTPAAGTAGQTVDLGTEGVVATLRQNAAGTGWTATSTTVLGVVPVEASPLVVTYAVGAAAAGSPVSPLEFPDGVTDLVVSWGDGSTSAGTTHTYAAAGEYTISVTGGYRSVRFPTSASSTPVELVQWGTHAAVPLEDLTGAFRGATDPRLRIRTAPPATVTSYAEMFRDSAFDGSVAGWDARRVTTTAGMFQGATSFDQPLDSWEVPLLVTADHMFDGASRFDSPLFRDVPALVSAVGMFRDAVGFAGDDASNIAGWDPVHLVDAEEMFRGATVFDGGIGSWTLGSLDRTVNMFRGAKAFDAGGTDIGGWDVSTVTNMREMFTGAGAFDRPLDSWDVGNVQSMFNMFTDATVFDRDLDSWDVSSVTSMNGMFARARAFDRPLAGWATRLGAVQDVNLMFLDASSFDQNISCWAVPRVAGPPADFATRSPLLSRPAWGVAATDATCDAGARPLEIRVEVSTAGADVSPVVFPASFRGVVAWGDGTVTEHDGETSPVHRYATAGEKTVEVVGLYPHVQFPTTAASRPGTLVTWGGYVTGLTRLDRAFAGSTDALALLEGPPSSVAYMNGMFAGSTWTGVDPQPAVAIGDWDVSGVKDMGQMFAGAAAFDAPVEGWDVSGVQSMFSMFQGAAAFDQPLDGWDVSHVKTMDGMFREAVAFDQPLPGWAGRLTHITSTSATEGYVGMREMFWSARSFDQSLACWAVPGIASTPIGFRDGSGIPDGGEPGWGRQTSAGTCSGPSASVPDTGAADTGAADAGTAPDAGSDAAAEVPGADEAPAVTGPEPAPGEPASSAPGAAADAAPGTEPEVTPDRVAEPSEPEEP